MVLYTNLILILVAVIIIIIINNIINVHTMPVQQNS